MNAQMPHRGILLHQWLELTLVETSQNINIDLELVDAEISYLDQMIQRPIRGRKLFWPKCKKTPWGFNFALSPPVVYRYVKLTPQLNTRLVFC